MRITSKAEQKTGKVGLYNIKGSKTIIWGTCCDTFGLVSGIVVFADPNDDNIFEVGYISNHWIVTDLIPYIGIVNLTLES